MTNSIQEYDFIGIGFGPANLSVAIALEEDARCQQKPLTTCFLDKKEQFEWHGGMLLDGTNMQINFMKDLATLRNPCSRYTFVNYLHSQERLQKFINLGTSTPPRVEFNSYLTWAAGAFNQQCHYGEEVINIEPIVEQGQVDKLKVTSRDQNGDSHVRITHNLSLGLGGVASVPTAFHGIQDRRIIHSSSYKNDIDSMLPERNQPHRIAVVGGGQSGAEIFLDLCGRYPNAEISMIVRGRTLRPSDDSPFVNEVFDADATDRAYNSRPQDRTAFLKEFKYTNYSVINMSLIEQLYELFYVQDVTDKQQHTLQCHQQVDKVDINESGIDLQLRDNISGQPSNGQFDAVILATGYRRDQYQPLLKNLAPYLAADTEIGRDYRLPSKPNMKANIFLQGANEKTHGLSDTLLSVVSVRAQEVVDAVYTNDTSLAQAETPLRTVAQ